MSCAHRWSRAIRGRRTGKWLRTCLACGTCEVSDTQPLEVERPRVSGATVEHEPFLDIRGRMARFDRGQVASMVRGAILDWRARQAGEK